MLRTANPLHAWALVIITVGITFFLWLVLEPLRGTLMSSMSAYIPMQANTPLNILNILWFGAPIIISVLMAIWAFLVTTKRQVLVNPGDYYT